MVEEESVEKKKGEIIVKNVTTGTGTGKKKMNSGLWDETSNASRARDTVIFRMTAPAKVNLRGNGMAVESGRDSGERPADRKAMMRGRVIGVTRVKEKGREAPKADVLIVAETTIRRTAPKRQGREKEKGSGCWKSGVGPTGSGVGLGMLAGSVV